MDRRAMIKGCKDWMLTRGNGSLLYTDGNDSRELLVVVFLRGGMDGLNLLAPIDDKNYRAARGGALSLKEDALRINQEIAKNDFRLHTKAAALKELYDDHSLAFIHAAGLTNGTRSHFEAQDLMELGSNKEKNAGKGWLARYVDSFHSGSIVPAYSTGTLPPVSLQGTMEQMNVAALKDLHLNANAGFMDLLQKMYGSGDSLVHQSGIHALQNLAHLKSKLSTTGLENYKPASTAKYFTASPGDELAKSFATVAGLIKINAGLKVATIDFDGWDMHDLQEWRFPQWTEALSKNLLAFYNDIHAFQNKVTVVVMTEFGRRLKANKNGGTDHGHGGLMMVLGGNVNGGKLFGDWPGLANEQLDNGVDLAVTTDYRKVISEIMVKRKMIADQKIVFPNYAEVKRPGIVK